MLNNEETRVLICDICGKTGARVRHITRSYGKGANLLVIENVPVVTCSHCGESYLTAETLHEIERIKMHRRSMAKPRTVPVAALPEWAAWPYARQPLPVCQPAVAVPVSA